MWTTEVAYSTNWQKELLCKRCQQHCQNSNAKLERQQQCLYTYACYPYVPVNRQEKEAVLLAHYCVLENRKQNSWSHFTPEDRRVGLLAKTYIHAQAYTSTQSWELCNFHLMNGHIHFLHYQPHYFYLHSSNK